MDRHKHKHSKKKPNPPTLPPLPPPEMEGEPGAEIKESEPEKDQDLDGIDDDQEEYVLTCMDRFLTILFQRNLFYYLLQLVFIILLIAFQPFLESMGVSMVNSGVTIVFIFTFFWTVIYPVGTHWIQKKYGTIVYTLPEESETSQEQYEMKVPKTHQSTTVTLSQKEITISVPIRDLITMRYPKRDTAQKKRKRLPFKDVFSYLNETCQNITVDKNNIMVHSQSEENHSVSTLWIYIPVVIFILAILTQIVLPIHLRLELASNTLSVLVSFSAFIVFMILSWAIIHYTTCFGNINYLHYFTVLNAFFPILYGSWLLMACRQLVTSNVSEWGIIIIAFESVLSEGYLQLMQQSLSKSLKASTHVGALRLRKSDAFASNKPIKKINFFLTIGKMTAPYLYGRFLFLSQITSYMFQYAIFGITPWSSIFIVMVCLNSIHKTFSSTDMYAQWFNYYILKQDPTPFQKLITNTHLIQLFAQNTLANILSIVGLAGIIYASPLYGIEASLIFVNFDFHLLWLRVTIILVFCLISFGIGQYIFTRRIEEISKSINTFEILQREINKYLENMTKDPHGLAKLKKMYQDEMPELFDHSQKENDQFDLKDYISRWKYLVEPKTLWKYFIYFHCSFYINLFIVSQSVLIDYPIHMSLYR